MKEEQEVVKKYMKKVIEKHKNRKLIKKLEDTPKYKININK
jgi:hypothetical protein